MVLWEIFGQTGLMEEQSTVRELFAVVTNLFRDNCISFPILPAMSQVGEQAINQGRVYDHIAREYIRKSARAICRRETYREWSWHRFITTSKVCPKVGISSQHVTDDPAITYAEPKHY